jgi:hypothetical protein
MNEKALPPSIHLTALENQSFFAGRHILLKQLENHLKGLSHEHEMGFWWYGWKEHNLNMNI